MPDLGSHVLGGYVIGKVIPGKDKITSLVLLGAILPDLLDKPFLIFFPNIYYYLLAFHSLWVQICLCIFISINIKIPKPKIAFICLFAGILSHLFLDSLQYTINKEHYPVFAPFSYYEPQIFLVPSEKWIKFLLSLAILALLIFIITNKRSFKKRG